MCRASPGPAVDSEHIGRFFPKQQPLVAREQRVDEDHRRYYRHTQPPVASCHRALHPSDFLNQPPLRRNAAVLRGHRTVPPTKVAQRPRGVRSPFGPGDSRAREIADVQQELLNAPQHRPHLLGHPLAVALHRVVRRLFERRQQSRRGAGAVPLRERRQRAPKARFSPATMPARSSSLPSVPAPPAYLQRFAMPRRRSSCRKFGARPEAGEPAGDSPVEKNRETYETPPPPCRRGRRPGPRPLAPPARGRRAGSSGRPASLRLLAWFSAPADAGRRSISRLEHGRKPAGARRTIPPPGTKNPLPPRGVGGEGAVGDYVRTPPNATAADTGGIRRWPGRPPAGAAR